MKPALRLRATAPYAVPLVMIVMGWPLLSPIPAMADNFHLFLRKRPSQR